MNEHLYGVLILLYPPEFRVRYADELMLDFQNLRAKMRRRPAAFALHIWKDLFISIPRENLRMFANPGIRRVIVLQALLMAAIITLVAMLCYLVSQQALRQGANYPQVQMAQDAAARLSTGSNLNLSASEIVDPARSLAPFLIVYDSQGRAVSSSAAINGKTPVPPAGVFEYLRSHAEDRISWQPRPGVRIAAVIMPYRDGFVLAGRSLVEVEASESKILYIAIAGWLALLGILFIGTTGMVWYTSDSGAQIAQGSPAR